MGPKKAKPTKAQIKQQQRDAYQRRWAQQPTPVACSASSDAFWRNKMFRSKGRPARCWTCRQGNRKMPAGKNIPDGTEEEDLVPCGCPFKWALIEEFLVERGIIRKRKPGETAEAGDNTPRLLGQQRPYWVEFFEMLFGELTPDKLNEQDKDKWKDWLGKNFKPGGDDDEGDGAGGTGAAQAAAA